MVIGVGRAAVSARCERSGADHLSVSSSENWQLEANLSIRSVAPILAVTAETTLHDR